MWINTGTLISRLNFVQAMVANGANASQAVVPKTDADLASLAAATVGADAGARTLAAIADPQTPIARRAVILLGSPEFQRR